MEVQTLGMIHAEGPGGMARELRPFVHIPAYDRVEVLLHESGSYEGPVNRGSKPI